MRCGKSEYQGINGLEGFDPIQKVIKGKTEIKGLLFLERAGKSVQGGALAMQREFQKPGLTQNGKRRVEEGRVLARANT